MLKMQLGSLREDDLVRDDAGVWVGIQQMEYGNLAAQYIPAMGAFTATGTPFSVAAGRISFTFGFKGPAVSILHSLKEFVALYGSRYERVLVCGHNLCMYDPIF